MYCALVFLAALFQLQAVRRVFDIVWSHVFVCKVTFCHIELYRFCPMFSWEIVYYLGHVKPHYDDDGDDVGLRLKNVIINTTQYDVQFCVYYAFLLFCLLMTDVSAVPLSPCYGIHRRVALMHMHKIWCLLILLDKSIVDYYSSHFLLMVLQYCHCY